MLNKLTTNLGIIFFFLAWVNHKP